MPWLHPLLSSSSSSSSSGVSSGRRLPISSFFENMLRTVHALTRTSHLIVVQQKYGKLTAPSVSLDALIEWDGSLLSEVSLECVDCLLYLCTLFPKDHEIDGDTLVQLWMAECLIKDEPMEDIGAAYLRALQSLGCVSMSRDSRGTGKLCYKVNDLTFSEELSSRMTHLRLDDDVAFGDSSLDTNLLKSFLKKRTLLFVRNHHHHGSAIAIDRVPYDFFTSSLRLLVVLSLSETRISEIPSSIGNVRGLRYLDLSKTLIKQLPETIDRLQQLQTLKLQSCPHLVTLPKRMVRITSLRHLDLGTTCHLHYMPLGMGALTCLRTLSEFLVGSGRGCSIAELKNLNNLKGNLCLSRLQNVAHLEEVKETKLSNKQLLGYLELRWSPSQRANIRLDDEVLGYLRPHTSLRGLRILHYRGSVFPSWISDPSFNNLLSITLFKCEHCSILPSLGHLPQLESLEVTGLTEVRTIDVRFYRDIGPEIANRDNEEVWFPRLQKLAFTSMLNLEKWENVRQCHFPLLFKLIVKDCPKLTTLCRLSNIYFLQYLEITACPLLPSLPKGCLPTSVEQLVIEDCPLLKSSCSKPHGQDWYKIEHILNVWVDYEVISSRTDVSEEDSSFTEDDILDISEEDSSFTEDDIFDNSEEDYGRLYISEEDYGRLYISEGDSSFTEDDIL